MSKKVDMRVQEIEEEFNNLKATSENNLDAFDMIRKKINNLLYDFPEFSNFFDNFGLDIQDMSKKYFENSEDFNKTAKAKLKELREAGQTIEEMKEMEKEIKQLVEERKSNMNDIVGLTDTIEQLISSYKKLAIDSREYDYVSDSLKSVSNLAFEISSHEANGVKSLDYTIEDNFADIYKSIEFDEKEPERPEIDESRVAQMIAMAQKIVEASKSPTFEDNKDALRLELKDFSESEREIIKTMVDRIATKEKEGRTSVDNEQKNSAADDKPNDEDFGEI